MTPYIAYPDIQGIIYENEMNRNRLMRTDALHKFSDGTLNHVRTTLNDIALGIKMDEIKGKVPTEMELVLEQTQQGTSHEVSVSAEGVEELKRKVKIKGEKKEALLTLRQKLEHQSDTKVFTMAMKILLEPTSNKLLVVAYRIYVRGVLLLLAFACSRFGALVLSVIEMCKLNIEYDWERMRIQVRWPTAGQPVAESQGGGIGGRVGRGGGRGRGPRGGNDDHVDELNGQGND
ncbi:hypothetical protein Tco_1055160 [Tanacetum coccineum]|uniref:Uncharacterized protein n=1 Tax=Tanacetum coccineum TaxID=301880 RepID=A0ABQ5GYT5_9ASTR